MTTQEQIKELHGRIETLRQCTAIEAKRKEVADNEAKSQEPGFWDDPKAAEAFLKKASSVKQTVAAFDKAASLVDDLDVLLEFVEGE